MCRFLIHRLVYLECSIFGVFACGVMRGMVKDLAMCCNDVLIFLTSIRELQHDCNAQHF